MSDACQANGLGVEFRAEMSGIRLWSEWNELVVTGNTEAVHVFGQHEVTVVQQPWPHGFAIGNSASDRFAVSRRQCVTDERTRARLRREKAVPVIEIHQFDVRLEEIPTSLRQS